MKRVTISDLENRVAELNANTSEKGGKYILARAYGGFQIQWVYADTSVREYTSGYETKSECLRLSYK